MSTLRVLIYMLGAWVGGVWVTCAGIAVVLDAWRFVALWTALSIALAVVLAACLLRDRHLAATS